MESRTVPHSSTTDDTGTGGSDLEPGIWFRQQRTSSISSQHTVSSTTLPSTIAPPRKDEEWAGAQQFSPRTYPMAWIALFFLVVLRSAVSIFQNTFNPIPNVIANYLNVNLTAINWLYNVMSIVYIIVSFGTGWLFEVLGPKKTVSVFAAVWFTEDKRATAGMFLIMVAVICTVALIPQFFIPAKPPTPSSIQLGQQNSGQPISVWKSTLTLLKNVHFWVLCGIHGLNVGLSIAWGGLTNQALSPYGYSDRDAGNIVAVGIFAGTLGCLTAGPLLDATKRHNLFLKMMAPFMCSTYIAFVFIATFPVPESISTSILWQMAQVIGFVLVLIMDNFRDPNGDPPNNMFKALIFQAAIAGVCVILCAVYNGPMRRTEAYRDAALTAAQEQIPEQDSAEKYVNNSRKPQSQASTDTIQVIDDQQHDDDLKKQEQ
ncbi:major facilitator superfamily domain-containing protein [Fennellomyces sp. T-0311]|nr:major facilitator superfamily domain-containing protein [Fennellomyces sp. T-0311]